MIDELFSASTISEPFRNIKEGVDADVPVDAQNASTATWKTADSFPQAPTPIIFLGGETRTEERPATKPTCYPCPRTVLLLMSPAAHARPVRTDASHRSGGGGTSLLGRHEALQFFSAIQQNIDRGRCRILLRALLHHQKASSIGSTAPRNFRPPDLFRVVGHPPPVQRQRAIDPAGEGLPQL